MRNEEVDYRRVNKADCALVDSEEGEAESTQIIFRVEKKAIGAEIC